MKKILVCAYCLLVAGVLLAAPKSYLDVPMSGVTNVAYMLSMSERPWWNEAWGRRAPILVSSRSDEPMENAVIDCIVDFGEAVNPDEVRVVTPWESEVPCIAEQADGQTIRLLFKTALRIRENKPFLVYWGNSTAKAPKVRSLMTLETADDEIRISNGAIDVTFDNSRRTGGLLKSIRALGSRASNNLLERATGYAYAGFGLSTGRMPLEWPTPAAVVSDNAFKKTVRFENAKLVVDYTLYADQPCLEYAYRIKSGDAQVEASISWACGGGTAYDDLVYPGRSCEPLKVIASLDHCSDCIPQPHYSLGKWIGEGWYAICDRRSHDVVGHVFDRSSLASFEYTSHGQAYGERANLCFRHANGSKLARSGKGALYAGIGEALDVRRAYRQRVNATVVFIGKAESRREIAVKVPRLDHDFVADYNIGKGTGMGWVSGDPLEGCEWAENICDHLRSFGANAVRTGGYGIQDLPISKSLYDRYVKYHEDPMCRTAMRFPAWQDGAFTGQKLREHCDAAHKRGMAVGVWKSFVSNWHWNEDVYFRPETYELECELEMLYAQCGADVMYNGPAASESPMLPAAWRRERGTSYWKWENPRDYFRLQEKRIEGLRRFYRKAKARYPELPVMTIHSENGQLAREMMSADAYDCFDSLYCELLPVWDDPKLLAHTKHGAKRLRALVDNAPGRTMFHHFFYWDANHEHRVNELEVPFICGINGFSHENLTYGNFNREIMQVSADFYRFCEYTRLGEKVAKMAPVKNLAVFRDARAYEEDIVAGRCRKPYPYQAQQDGRVNAFAEIRNLSYDVVINPFFTAKSLAKYNVVYIPEDVAFSKELADELVAYVKAGGGAIVEGATVEKAERLRGLKDGVVEKIGKGKMLWLRECLTDRVAKRERKAWAEMRARLASVGGVEPFTVTGAEGLDGILQSGAEGLFLGVYNWNGKAETGKVVLDRSTISICPSKSLFVLDVKSGVRVAYTNGFEITVGPQQCGYYLVGDDAFTALPAAKIATWCGAEAAAENPKGASVIKASDSAFRPAEAIEVSVFSDGKPSYVRRADSAHIAVTKIDAADPDERAFARALKTASYVHLLPGSFGGKGASADALFESQAENLKAFLKRGGGLLFDRSSVGPNARSFLKEVGVFDPTAGAEKGVGDGSGRWSPSVSTNHTLFAQCDCGVGEPGFGSIGYGLAYPKWDVKTQTAPVRAARDDGYGVLVMQENVLGKGRVAFSENTFAFNDFYENKAYGNNLLSWFIGMSVNAHAQKVIEKNGGPGEELGK